jgi:chorismate--pyruvate lyase
MPPNKLPKEVLMIYRSALWHAPAFCLLHDCPPLISDWLQTSGSMTKRLLAASSDTLEVQVLEQSWQWARPEEYHFLGIKQRTRVLVREVFLCGHGEPWIFARSIFPQTLFTGPDRWLLNCLDTRPIGPFLYRHQHMKRRFEQFAKLHPKHWEYQNLTRYFKAEDESLWARRACFYLYDKPLMVSEIILPALRNQNV